MVNTLNRLAIFSRWSVRSGGVEHYVDRQSELDANAPVLAPLDYLVSRVTVPPSTVGFTHCFGSHPDGGLPDLAVDQSAHADPTIRTPAPFRSTGRGWDGLNAVPHEGRCPERIIPNRVLGATSHR